MSHLQLLMLKQSADAEQLIFSLLDRGIKDFNHFHKSDLLALKNLFSDYIKLEDEELKEC